jgi:D-serine deaminase-like pyridoxal phosphate-dependent protein
MDRACIAALDDTPVDWRYKGFPVMPPGTTVADLRDAKLNVVDGDLLLPALVLKERALEHNLALMAAYCDAQGVSLAPHAKTSLCPQLLARHVDAGAWGFTVATTSQARVLRAFGFQRLLLASQVVEASAARWIARELDGDDDLDVLCLVDSTAGVALLSDALAAAGARRPVRALVELGYAGGRTGCRTVEDGVEVAHTLRASPALELAGVEGFEGLIELPADDPAAGLAAVDAFLRDLRRLAETLDRQGAFDGLAEVIVSAGGSAYFDRVVAVLTGWDLTVPVRTVLRSGCYATHDSQMYEQSSPLAERGGGERLEAAFEVWGAVWSRPERDLAIVGMGKRDAPYDYRLPVPLWVRGRDGGRRAVRGELTVTGMNDQHAYVRVPPHDPLTVGDLVGVGISHPCTAFDKWRLVPVVDDRYTVVGAYHTFF